MRSASGMGAAAGAAALPFGAATGWLRWLGYYVPDARTGWMVFWLCGALLVYLLHAAQPPENSDAAEGRWHCVSTRQRPLEGLLLPLVSACLLCILGALGELCLQLPPAGAALWSGGAAAALVWLLLCLLALVCRWEER
jgi:hypothetical protein